MGGDGPGGNLSVVVSTETSANPAGNSKDGLAGLSPT